MKKYKYIITLIISLSITHYSTAQLKDWVTRKKEEAKQKVNNKIEQKSSEGIDKVVDAPEKAVKKKAKKNKKQNENDEAQATNDAPTTIQPIGEIIISTNIKCDEGKRFIEQIINDTPGVSSSTIDIKTGKLYINLTGDATNKEAIETLIRQNGYEANDKKKIKGTNACN